MSAELAIVVAVAGNGVIGRGNEMPWRLRTDLRHFRDLTMGKPILMGRKTYVSIGRPLPGRRTIGLTRDAGFRAEGVEIAHTLEAARAAGDRIAAEMGAREVMVVGGAEIYRLLLPSAQRLHVTEIEARPEGDAFFPAIDRERFREISRKAHPAGSDDEFPFAFVDYVRIAPPVTGMRNSPH
jgi:dihydrofolate reductase